MVAGDKAAKPCVPTVFPMKALSMLDRSGLQRKMPRAGSAKPSILRLEAFTGAALLLEEFDADWEESSLS